MDKNATSIVGFGVDSQRKLAQLNDITSDIIRKLEYSDVLDCFQELLSIAGQEGVMHLIEREHRVEEIQKKFTAQRIELMKQGKLLQELRHTNEIYIEELDALIEKAVRYGDEGIVNDDWQEDVFFRKDMVRKRIQELRTTRSVAESFSVQIALSEENCFKMADRVWDAMVTFMPILRSRITVENSKTVIDQTRFMIRESLSELEKMTL